MINQRGVTLVFTASRINYPITRTDMNKLYFIED